MTISVPNQLVYSSNGDGATSQFSYPVRILEASELVVIRSEGGVDTTLTLNTDYTLSGIGDAGGVTITMLSVPTAGQEITRYRATAPKQIVDLKDKQTNPAEAVEQQLDRLAMVGQDHDQRISEYEDRIDDLDSSVAAAAASATAAGTSETNAAASATAAGTDADRAEAAAASIDYLTVADRTAVRAVDTVAHTVVFVRDVGMNAKWDATVPVATHQADTAENIYVAPDPAAVGAWVFQDGKAVSLAFPAYNRPLWAKLGDFFTAKDAGLKGDGVDDTDPMDALLTYCGANLATVHFPDGKYRVTEALLATVSAGKALIWKGTGGENSIIALDTGGDGFTFNLPGNYWLDADPGRSGLQLSDLGFTTTNANAGKGLVIEGQALVGRPMAGLRFDRLTMRAESLPNTQGWATFIEPHNVGGIWMNTPRLILGGPNNEAAIGIHVYCDVDMDGGSISLIHPQILYGHTSILAGQHTEGYYVTQPEIVGPLYGFRTDLTAGESGYHLLGGHINAKQACVLLDYGYDFSIIGMLLWRLGTTKANWNAVQLSNGGRGEVAANNIKGQATGGDETGINVVSSESSGSKGISVMANTLTDLSGRGVWAAAAAAYVDIGPNTYRNVATRILNQSASGSVSIQPKVYSTSKVFTLTGGAATENLDIPLPIGMFTSAPGNVEVNDGAGTLRGAYDFANSTATTARIIIRNFAGGNIVGTAYRLGVVATENTG